MSTINVERVKRNIQVSREQKNVKVVRRQKTYDIHAGGRRGLKGDPGEPGVVQEVVAGTNVVVDSTDPARPIVSAPAGSDAHYQQAFTFQDIIVVNHNLNKLPAVTVLDSTGDEVVGDVIHNNPNQLTVYLNAENTGTVTCN